jgi:hypothetical protein
VKLKSRVSVRQHFVNTVIQSTPQYCLKAIKIFFCFSRGICCSMSRLQRELFLWPQCVCRTHLVNAQYFLCLSRKRRDVVNVHKYSCKLSLILSRLKLESAGQILVKIPYIKCQGIHSSESLVVHVDRRTDGQTERT